MKVIKQIYVLLFLVITLMVGCTKKEIQLSKVTISAYFEDEKISADFALVDPNQYGILINEHKIDEYFSTMPMLVKTSVAEFSSDIIPGEYIVIIRLKNGYKNALPGTYTYSFITTRGQSAKFKYQMQFSTTKQSLYQPWTDKP